MNRDHSAEDYQTQIARLTAELADSRAHDNRLVSNGGDCQGCSGGPGECERLRAERDAASATLRLVRSMVEHERGVRDQATRGGQSTGESPRMGVQMLHDLERALGADDGRYLQEQWAKLEAERDEAIQTAARIASERACEEIDRRRAESERDAAVRERDEARKGNTPCVDDNGTLMASARTWRKAYGDASAERDALRADLTARDCELNATRAELRTMISPCEHARLMAEASDPALRERVTQLQAEVDRRARTADSLRHDLIAIANGCGVGHPDPEEAIKRIIAEVKRLRAIEEAAKAREGLQDSADATPTQVTIHNVMRATAQAILAGRKPGEVKP